MELLERGVFDWKNTLMTTIGAEDPQTPEGNCSCHLRFIKNKDTAATRVEYALIMLKEQGGNEREQAHKHSDGFSQRLNFCLVPTEDLQRVINYDVGKERMPLLVRRKW